MAEWRDRGYEIKKPRLNNKDISKEKYLKTHETTLWIEERI